MREVANVCIKCGAPLKGKRCEYCGAEYADEGFHGDFKSYYGTIKVCDEEIRCYIGNIECTFLADHIPSRGVNGRIRPIKLRKKRIITLIEE